MSTKKHRFLIFRVKVCLSVLDGVLWRTNFCLRGVRNYYPKIYSGIPSIDWRRRDPLLVKNGRGSVPARIPSAP